MLVQLSRKDAHKATMMGVDTVALCKMQGFAPRLENENQSREDANSLGYMAEFAVARLLDLEEPEISVHTDGGVDLWAGDISIDVKFTNMRKDPPLIFDSMAKFKADVAVLVTCEDDYDNVFKVHGWTHRRVFKDGSYKHNYGYGDRLVMDVNQLDKIEHLWGYIKAAQNGTLPSYMADTWGIA